MAGGAIHYGRVLSGRLQSKVARDASARVLAKAGDTRLFRIFNRKSPIAVGLAAGLVAMLPFVPGMLGSRSTPDELRRRYSGEDPVAVRAGRWWDLGSNAFAGSRIIAYRPHWYQLYRTRAERKSIYGSEQEYWRWNPLLHPIRFLTDPYAVERATYQDRPYPITSPAFSNVPLIGPLLAATIGKIVKPPVRMHEGEWSGEDYNLFSTRLEPGPMGLPPRAPVEEFGLWDAVKQTANRFMDFIGLPGFLMRSTAPAMAAALPQNQTSAPVRTMTPVRISSVVKTPENLGPRTVRRFSPPTSHCRAGCWKLPEGLFRHGFRRAPELAQPACWKSMRGRAEGSFPGARTG